MVTGKTTIGLEGYLEAYLAASREHGFTPSDLRGVIRYLLVNGRIDISDKHIELMGNTEFYLGTDNIPKDYRRRADLEPVKVHEKLINASNEVDRKDWTLDDDFEMEHKKLLSTTIEGIWLKNGRVNGIKIGETRIVEVYQTYHVPIDVPLFDEIELNCPDCAGILEILETPHPKGWTHLCKGDCGGYHAPYGKNYSNMPLFKETDNVAAVTRRFCVSCGSVEVDDEDNTITFEKDDGFKITGRVCSNCYFELEEEKKDV